MQKRFCADKHPRGFHSVRGLWLHRLMARTTPSHGVNGGSIPPGATTELSSALVGCGIESISSFEFRRWKFVSRDKIILNLRVYLTRLRRGELGGKNQSLSSD